MPPPGICQGDDAVVLNDVQVLVDDARGGIQYADRTTEQAVAEHLAK